MLTTYEYDGSRLQDPQEREARLASSTSNYHTHPNGFPEHTVVLYPGEAISLLFRVYGPEGHDFTPKPVGFPYHVARLTVSPSQGVAPFVAKVVIAANEAANQGSTRGAFMCITSMPASTWVACK